MKKCFLLMCILIYASASNAQCSPELRFKPLPMFSADTAAFVMYNFRDRGDCYKGKTFKNVLDDFGFKIKTFILVVDKDDPKRLIGIDVYPYEQNEIGRRNHFQLETHGIKIFLNEAMDAVKYLDFANRTKKNEWHRKIYNIFKNKTIRFTRSVIHHYSPYRETYKDQLED